MTLINPRQILPENADAEARSNNNEQQHSNMVDLSSLIKDLMENINSMKEDIKILKGDSLSRRSIRLSKEQSQIQKTFDTDSSVDHNTLKSAYKGLNNNRQPPCRYVKTQYGYSQESLPNVETLLKNFAQQSLKVSTLI